MNDKPTVQVKLSIADLNAIREIILRDYRATLNEISKAPNLVIPEQQRCLIRTERLAEIFSVTLPKR